MDYSGAGRPSGAHPQISLMGIKPGAWELTWPYPCTTIDLETVLFYKVLKPRSFMV